MKLQKELKLHGTMTQMGRIKCTTNKNSFEDRYKVRRVEIDSI